MNDTTSKRRIRVDGAPVGKARPRFSRIGGGRIYTPQRTVDYEHRIRDRWKKTYPSEDPYTGPIRVYLEVFYPIPKSTSKADRQKMLDRKIFPVKKPDIDNVIKSVLDGLQGAAFGDDASVVSVMSYKVYSEDPHILVTIEEVS